MDDQARPGAVAGRDVEDLLAAVVANVGEALDLWSVDLWTFSDDADTLECRAYWCRDPAAAKTRGCVGAVIGLDQSHDLRRLVLTGQVVERHVDDELPPADAAALAQAGFTHRIDVPLLAGRRGARRPEPRGDARRAPSLRGGAGPSRGALPPGGRGAARGGALRGRGCADGAAHGHARRRPRHLRDAVAGGDRRRGARGGRAARRAAWSATPRCVLRQDDGTFAPAGEAGTGARGRRLARRRPGAAGRGSRTAGAGADGRRPRPAPAAADGRRARSSGYLELTAALRRPFREAEIELASLLAGQAAAALERAKAFRAVQSRSATDTLTGLYSRWYFYERLYAEVARARRYRQPLSLVVAELDGEEELARRRGASLQGRGARRAGATAA